MQLLARNSMLTVLIASCSAANALLVIQRPIRYPALDVFAPENPEWTNYFLRDMNIPAIPLNKVPVAKPDWAKDVTRCVNNTDFALTYDDGPSPNTPAVLLTLANTSTLATFFAVGSRVHESPQNLKNTFGAGHQIGSHTWSHPHLTYLTNGQIVAEIMYSSLIIQDTIGVTPTFFRPPYGDIDERVRAVIKAMGLTIVAWSLDSTDSKDPKTAKPITEANRWPSLPRAGSISLEHERDSYEASFVSPILNIVNGMHVTTKRIDSCLGKGAASSYIKGDLSQMQSISSLSANATSSSSSSGSSATVVTTSPKSSGSGTTSNQYII